jgi:hypothetical protein
MATNLSNAITFKHPYLWSTRLLDGSTISNGPTEMDGEWLSDYYCALGELMTDGWQEKTPE